MKKVLFNHFLYSALLITLMTLAKRWFDWDIIALLAIGGFIGAILPDVDHLIYIYLLRPNESSSQETTRLIQERKFAQAFDRLAIARQDRKNLIFHSVLFQVLFLVFSYLVVSSSINFLGRGLVLAFALHLAIDQLIDLVKLGNIDNWFYNVKVTLRKEQQTFYWAINLLLILLFSFIF